jgi:hypothetical protein
LTTVVRKTRLFETMGDDQPRPGISVFQATFSVADQRSGNPGASETPRASGPRNWGQSDRAADVMPPERNRARSQQNLRIGDVLVKHMPPLVPIADLTL